MKRDYFTIKFLGILILGGIGFFIPLKLFGGDAIILAIGTALVGISIGILIFFLEGDIVCNCEYVRNYYGVPARIGLLVVYNDKKGQIYKDGGAYISVNFDSDKAGVCKNIHPIDPNLVYTDKVLPLRKMTHSQKHYQDWLNFDDGLSFAEYMDMDKDTLKYKKSYKS